VLEQGPVEQTIIKQCMRERLPLPKKIAEAPDLLPGLELYFAAWVDLDTTRPVGFELGPISWSAIQEYAAYLCLEAEDRDDLHYLIRVLDNAFLMYHRKRSRGGSGGKSK